MPILQRDDVELYYEVSGEGRPFVFISETACDGECGRCTRCRSTPRDHQCITFDYRGTGRSGKPSIPYTTDMFADDVAAIMDHVGASDAIVCGHSMGGRVAQLLALDHPGKVSKLILASSGASFPDTKGIPSSWPRPWSKWDTSATSAKARWPWVLPKRSRSSIRNASSATWTSAWPTRARRSFTSATSSPARRTTPASGSRTSRCRRWSWWGRTTRSVTSDMDHRTSADILANGIPGARLVILPGERHSYFFANPEASFKAIRDFL